MVHEFVIFQRDSVGLGGDWGPSVGMSNLELDETLSNWYQCFATSIRNVPTTFG